MRCSKRRQRGGKNEENDDAMPDQSMVFHTLECILDIDHQLGQNYQGAST